MTNDEAIKLEYSCFAHLPLFCKAIYPDFDIEAYHIKKLSSALEGVENGTIKRLIITMPPRHGKSMLTSELFPTWYLGRNPDKRVMFATYNHTFASEFGRKVRNHLQDKMVTEIFPSCRIADDSSAADKFVTTQGGAYYAGGVGGSMTGRGTNLLIIDDALKNREEADSELIRQKLKDWYTSTAYTRLEPNAAVIVIQTRWHSDDLAGWLLSENKDNWTVIDFPAIIKDNNGNDASLWPAKYSLQDLYRIRDNVSSRDWAALYMQQPVVDGGQVFKETDMRYYENDLDLSQMNVYAFVDPANSKKPNADNTAMIVIGASKDGNIYLIDAWVDKLNLKERENLLFYIHSKYRPNAIYYEKYGMQLDIEFMRQAMEVRNYRFELREIGGNKLSKEDRIKRLQPLFEDHKIYFPRFIKKPNYLGKEVDLVSYFLDSEFRQFPYAKHDDMIDVLSRICDVNMLFPKKTTVNYYELYG